MSHINLHELSWYWSVFFCKRHLRVHPNASALQFWPADPVGQDDFEYCPLGLRVPVGLLWDRSTECQGSTLYVLLVFYWERFLRCYNESYPYGPFYVTIRAHHNDANLLYTQYCFGVLAINFVLDLRKLCFLSKQRCHSISVDDVFYDIFGFSEFNRLCSVYSVCGQSRGYFIASVWDVFRDLAFWLLYCI